LRETNLTIPSYDYLVRLSRESGFHKNPSKTDGYLGKNHENLLDPMPVLPRRHRVLFLPQPDILCLGFLLCEFVASFVFDWQG
jgi:hypothetical protein